MAEPPSSSPNELIAEATQERRSAEGTAAVGDGKLSIGIVAGNVPSGIEMVGAPLIMGALVDDRGFTSTQAASLTSAELLASALTVLAVAGLMTRSSRARWAASGLAIAGAALILSVFVFDFWPLLALRTATGVGAGLAMSAATAAGAGSRDPERVFAIAGLAGAVLAAAVLAPLGLLIGHFGASGAFAVVGVGAWLAVPFAFWLPGPPRSHREPPAQRERSSRRIPLPALGILGALGMISLAQNAVWTHSERIGQHIGLEVETISFSLAASELAALLGAGAAVALSTRLGRLGPLALSIICTVLSIALLVRASGVVGYTTAMVVWAIFFSFSMPYFLGALSAIDAAGRWTNVGGGLSSIAAALGPRAVAGSVGLYGFDALAIWMAASGLIGLGLLVPAIRRIDRGDFRAPAKVIYPSATASLEETDP